MRQTVGTLSTLAGNSGHASRFGVMSMRCARRRLFHLGTQRKERNVLRGRYVSQRSFRVRWEAVCAMFRRVSEMWWEIFRRPNLLQARSNVHSN